MEQRIRALCIEVQNTHDSDRIEQIGDKLRTAIHVHVEHLRNEVAALATAAANSAGVGSSRKGLSFFIHARAGFLSGMGLYCRTRRSLGALRGSEASLAWGRALPLTTKEPMSNLLQLVRCSYCGRQRWLQAHAPRLEA